MILMFDVLYDMLVALAALCHLLNKKSYWRFHSAWSSLTSRRTSWSCHSYSFYIRFSVTKL